MRKLFFLFIISLLSLSGFAQVEVGGLWYILDESTKTAEVTQSGGDSYSGDIIIPSTVTYNDVTYAVKSIGEGAFFDIPLSSVTIEDGIETIEKQAFYDSDGIYKLRLPSTLKTIGEEAFTYAYITTLTLPEGLISIGKRAFSSCGRLIKVILPSSLTEIGENVFSNCGSLSIIVSHIQVPFEISSEVFSSNTSATLYVPDGTKSTYESTAGWNMFADIIEGELKEATVDGLMYSYFDGKGVATVVGRADEELHNITIPGSVSIEGANYTVKTVGNRAFYNCGIDTLTIGEGVETIGKDAFRENYSLRSISFPSTLKIIGEWAFYYCDNLKSIELPASLDSIGDYAFYQIRGLSLVQSRILHPFAISESVFAMSSNWNSETQQYTYTPSSATLYVPDGTKSTYESTVGWKGMFADIIEGELKEATIDGLMYNYLAGKGVATVVGRADEELHNITIPGSVSIEGANYTVKTVGNRAFYNCDIDTLTIGEGVETIGKDAFRENYSLRSISFPSSLKIIGEYAFNYCYNVKNVELPASLDSIGDYAFSRIRELSLVQSRILHPFAISESVFARDWSSNWDSEQQKDIYTYTPSSATLYVPDGTKSTYESTVGWKGMFADIIEGELKEATVDGLMYSYLAGKGVATVVGRADEELHNITIPGSVSIEGANYTVKAVENRAFYNCGIDTLTIGEGVETIGKEAFRYNYSLRSISFPSTLKVIGEYAFNYCDNLKSIELPASLDSIGDYAFSRIRDLSLVQSRILHPFAISESVFAKDWSSNWDSEQQKDIYTYTPSSATLYVPDGTKSTYESTVGWKGMFADIIEGELKEATVDGLMYSYLDGKGVATVVGRADEELHKITIPGSVSIEGANYTVKTVGNRAFYSCGIDTLTIGEGVETIGKEAFRENYNLRSISFPSTLKVIGEHAFNYCYNVKNVELPASLDSIGDYAFYQISNLSLVQSRILHPFAISESVFAKGWSSSNWNSETQQYDYTYTPSSATLYVPDGTKSTYESTVGWKGMFADIIEGELKEATVDGLMYSYLDGKGVATVVGRADEELHKITIPGSVSIEGANYTVKTVGNRAFYSCGIDTLTIGEGVETIGKEAFRSNYSLRSISFPSTLKIIGEHAFSYCYDVKNVELPASLDSIGDYAFYQISNLSLVQSRILHPFAISESVFARDWSSNWDSEQQKDIYTYTPSSATLYVPDGTKSTYESTVGWKGMFADIIEGELKEATVDGLMYSYLDGKGVATVVGRADEELHNITIPGSVSIEGANYTVKTVGNRAFYSCDIDTLTIGEGVETIGKEAFRENYNLRSISFPSTLKIIGEWAFNYCYNVKNVELPASLDSIGDYAFSQIRNLSSVLSRIQRPFAISESVFAINWSWDYSEGDEKQVFTKSNANLYVPEGTMSLYQAAKGWNMFAGIYEGELREAVVDGLKYAYLPSSQVATVVSGDYSELEVVKIPGTIYVEGVTYQVKEIGAGAFQDCYNLDSVTISNGIEIIGKRAFQSCWYTTFSDLPSSLKTIGEQAFWNNNGFKNLIIPEGVTSIGIEAFGACHQIQKVKLPSTLTTIGERAFYDLSSLTTVVSTIQNPFEIHQNVFGIYDREEWDDAKQQWVQYYNPSPATLCVPEGTISKYQALLGWTMFADIIEGELLEVSYGDLSYIANNARKTAVVTKGENYNQLTKVTIPGSFTYDGINYQVTGINARAFANTSITSVTIEDGLTSIGQEAFNNCTQLAEIRLPNTLTEILSDAFNSCYRIKSLFIPASVKNISSAAFTWMQNLNTIQVAAENTVYDSRNDCNAVIEKTTNTLVVGAISTVIPDDVTAIGDLAFSSRDISKISIPASVKWIGRDAFSNCSYLTEVVLPEGVDSLGAGAFNNCERLVTIELPSSMRQIEEWSLNSNNLQNVVVRMENPIAYSDLAFGEYGEIYNRATLWVPRGKVAAYKSAEGWENFQNYDELLGDVLTKPTISYNGRYMTMTNDASQKAKIYYSLDGSEPTQLYSDTIAISNLATVLAVSKRFGSFTVDTARYEVQYVFDGVTARTTTGGLLKSAFEWYGTDKVESLDIDGMLNDDDFATIRSFAKLTTLNMAASRLTNGAIPAEAFANTNLQWYVSPYAVNSVGANIFKGCQQLAAITWNSTTVELPADVATDVANPNMLVYAKALAMIPYTLRNVVVNGVANTITLADSVGNNNFFCPEPFVARRISYTHNYQQKTARGKSQGWETLALPFTVDKVTHETNGELTPASVEGAAKLFWLYELGDNGLEPATQIRANIPYLISMPNDDAYGDEFIQSGRVTFSALNAQISSSTGITISQGNRQFVPTYQRVAPSTDIYVLNVGQAVGENPEGSAFIISLREVRPFEAYSVHTANSRSRSFSVSSLGGSDTTGIDDAMQSHDEESADSLVKVYSLSGALIQQGKRGEVLRSLPKGLYIINGKKVIK